MTDMQKRLHDLHEATWQAFTDNRELILQAWDRATDGAPFMYEATATGSLESIRSRIIVAEQELYGEYLHECSIIEDVVFFLNDAEHLYEHIQEAHSGVPPARFPEDSWGQLGNHRFWQRNWPLMPRLALRVPRGEDHADVLFLYRHAR
jgi:hypothetical protein